MQEAAEAYEARWARHEDEPRVFALVCALAEEIGGEAPSRAEFSATFSRAFVPDARFRFALVERETRPVACASLHVGFSTWRGRPTIEIHDDYVVPDERASDRAWRRLLGFAEAFARTVGAVRLECRERRDDREAVAEFERHGFRDTGYVLMRKRLDPPT